MEWIAWLCLGKVFLIFDFYIQSKNQTRIKHAKTFGRPMSGDNVRHVG